MADKVQPGDPLVIPASVYNSVLDLIDKTKPLFSTSMLAGEYVGRGRGALCRVKNTTGALVQRYGVLGINGNLHNAATSLSEMQNNPVLIGVTPTTGHFGNFCIAVEPIEPNQIGLAAYSGAVLTKVYVNGSLQDDFRCADVRVGNTETLQAVPNGGAKILWIEEATDPDDPDYYVRWAFVRIDSGNYVEFVNLTSTEPGDDGYYNGMVQVYRLDTDTWIDAFACKVVDIGALS